MGIAQGKDDGTGTVRGGGGCGQLLCGFSRSKAVLGEKPAPNDTGGGEAKPLLDPHQQLSDGTTARQGTQDVSASGSIDSSSNSSNNSNNGGGYAWGGANTTVTTSVAASASSEGVAGEPITAAETFPSSSTLSPMTSAPAMMSGYEVSLTAPSSYSAEAASVSAMADAVFDTASASASFMSYEVVSAGTAADSAVVEVRQELVVVEQVTVNNMEPMMSSTAEAITSMAMSTMSATESMFAGATSSGPYEVDVTFAESRNPVALQAPDVSRSPSPPATLAALPPTTIVITPRTPSPVPEQPQEQRQERQDQQQQQQQQQQPAGVSASLLSLPRHESTESLRRSSVSTSSEFDDEIKMETGDELNFLHEEESDEDDDPFGLKPEKDDETYMAEDQREMLQEEMWRQQLVPPKPPQVVLPDPPPTSVLSSSSSSAAARRASRSSKGVSFFVDFSKDIPASPKHDDDAPAPVAAADAVKPTPPVEEVPPAAAADNAPSVPVESELEAGLPVTQSAAPEAEMQPAAAGDGDAQSEAGASGYSADFVPADADLGHEDDVAAVLEALGPSKAKREEKAAQEKAAQDESDSDTASQEETPEPGHSNDSFLVETDESDDDVLETRPKKIKPIPARFSRTTLNPIVEVEEPLTPSSTHSTGRRYSFDITSSLTKFVEGDERTDARVVPEPDAAFLETEIAQLEQYQKQIEEMQEQEETRMQELHTGSVAEALDSLVEAEPPLDPVALQALAEEEDRKKEEQRRKELEDLEAAAREQARKVTYTITVLDNGEIETKWEVGETEKERAEHERGDQLRSLEYRMVESEQEYHRHISTCLQRYYRPLTEQKHREFCGLTSSDVAGIFSNMSSLLSLHNTIMDDIDDWEVFSVSSVLTKNAHHFKLYKVFVDGFDRYLSTLNRLSKNRRFLLAIKLVQKSTGCLDLTEYMLLPFVRILDYNGYINDLVRLTPETQSNYKKMLKAQRAIGEVFEYVSSRQQFCVQMSHLLLAQTTIINLLNPLLDPERRLLLKDRLFMLPPPPPPTSPLSSPRQSMSSLLLSMDNDGADPLSGSGHLSAIMKKAIPYTFYLFSDKLLWVDRNNKLQDEIDLSARHYIVRDTRSAVDIGSRRSSRGGSAGWGFDICEYKAIGEPTAIFRIECASLAQRNQWVDQLAECIKKIWDPIMAAVASQGGTPYNVEDGIPVYEDDIVMETGELLSSAGGAPEVDDGEIKEPPSASRVESDDGTPLPPTPAPPTEEELKAAKLKETQLMRKRRQEWSTAWSSVRNLEKNIRVLI